MTGAEIAATGDLVVSAGRDLALTAAKVSAGGDASLSAGRDVVISPALENSSASSNRGMLQTLLLRKHDILVPCAKFGLQDFACTRMRQIVCKEYAVGHPPFGDFVR